MAVRLVGSVIGRQAWLASFSHACIIHICQLEHVAKTKLMQSMAVSRAKHAFLSATRTSVPRHAMLNANLPC